MDDTTPAAYQDNDQKNSADGTPRCRGSELPASQEGSGKLVKCNNAKSTMANMVDRLGSMTIKDDDIPAQLRSHRNLFDFMASTIDAGLKDCTEYATEVCEL
ncbi:hypothetical protein AC578_6808 [Pseudocercospora eumusae]|uniref:Uncharacterized protein n=1 Tax=Pseudocercospora eumusae TaxID=321146 RepID=A0A139GWC2_9PEZI|nr:hypothetical protein AC578_6808 [Pseudocercospora eumusae]